MRSMQRIAALGLLALCIAGMIGWTMFRPQAGPTHPLDQMMPEGALLYIEARDFAGLLKDWNAAPERGVDQERRLSRVFKFKVVSPAGAGLRSICRGGRSAAGHEVFGGCSRDGKRCGRV